MQEQNPEPADLNIDRLLSEAYQPEAIDAEFARKTVAYLEKLAAERRQLPSPWRYVAWLYLANAMAILLLIVMPPLFWHYFIEEPRRQEEEKKRKEKRSPSPTDRVTPKTRTQRCPCDGNDPAGWGLQIAQRRAAFRIRSRLLATQIQPVDFSGFQRVNAANYLDSARGGEILNHLALVRQQACVMADIGCDPGSQCGVLVFWKGLADVYTVNQLPEVPFELTAGQPGLDRSTAGVSEDNHQGNVKVLDGILN
jgi:hypothetical protein